MAAGTLRAYRGSILHCLRDPGMAATIDDEAVVYFPDGLLLVEDGYIREVTDAGVLTGDALAGIEVIDYSGKLIMPGLIDSHIHYPQTNVIASYGTQLLDWLERYTFPEESRFHDVLYAREAADFFIDELLRNGTTTALVLGTVHTVSVNAIFEAAGERNLRLIAGKVLMDRNCPENLRDDAESAYRESKALIERWHKQGQDRLQYAITPRFAPTSTELQLERAGQLAREHPDVFVHTHVAENRDEVRWVAELYPWSRSYLDVYDRFDLLRERSVFAHCIYLDKDDRRRMAETGASMVFCPTANLFLGSGLFDLEAAKAEGVKLGLGTDVGGGTSFSLLRTLSEAYKVTQMKGYTLSPYQALYQATLGSAEALCLDDKIGNFSCGKEADFIVIDMNATPLMSRRMQAAGNIREKLFALIMLGDDRAVSATYCMGERCY